MSDQSESVAVIEDLKRRNWRLAAAMINAALTCRRWAKESREGSWSTHQVEQNKALATELERVISDTEHPDDKAVWNFAWAMVSKLKKKREDGRTGWWDKDFCSNEYLSKLLREHVDKGDPVDVANFAMMLHQRGERIAPPPQPNVLPTTSPWQWWAGSSEEWCTVGPEDTRAAIIQAATNDSLGEFEHEGGGWNLGFYIVEARQDPLRLADWIESDRLLERAEDNVADSDRAGSEYDDGPWFKCTPEQEKDLEERIKRACDEWQAAHALIFSCSTFSHARNQEHVVVDHPQNATATEGSDNADS